MQFDFNPVSLLKRLAVAYICICAFMWAFQRHLIYAPVKGIHAPEAYGLQDFSVVPLVTDDGVHLQAWYHAARASYPTILYFHGNGGNLSNRAQYFAHLSAAGFGVLGVDYRGYGASGGSPSEQGFYSDARAAVRYAQQELSLTPQRMVFYGESIGTGVAMQMAVEYKPAVLVMQSAFTALSAPASAAYPWLPVKLLLKDRYDSISKLKELQSPLLVLHGEKDHIVPVGEGQELFARAPEPKQAVFYPQGGHNDLDLAALTQAILAFSKAQGVIGAN